MYTARLGTDAVVIDSTGEIIGPEAEDKWQVYQAWLSQGNSPAPALQHIDPRLVQLECQRRIYAVASVNCQASMNAHMLTGDATESDLQAFIAFTRWRTAMTDACRKLALANNPSYTEDVHWPPCPDAVVALADRF